MPVPVLTIEIPWDPDITTLGGLLITWHGLFTAVGILAGVQLALRMARVVGFDEDDAYTLALIGVPGGVIGARLLFIAERGTWSPREVIAITEGGISIWGAILGGVAAALAFAVWRGYPIARGLDIGAFGLILGQAVGRIGDLINGEHIAKATSLPWGVIYTDPDSPAFAHGIRIGETAPSATVFIEPLNRAFTFGAVHPATTYELLGDLAILGLLFVALYRVFPRRPGLTFFVYLVGYAVMRFFMTYLRIDSSETLLALKVPQLVALLVVLAAIPGIWYFWRQPQEPPDSPVGPSEPPRRRGLRVRVRE